MSRAYRISVKESLSRHVEVEDGVCSSLELLPILAKERMGELLAAELEQRGFKREGNVAQRKEGDVLVEVNLESGLVSVTAEGHAQVNLETERTAVVDNTLAGDRERHLRDAAKQSLEREAKAEEEALRRKVTEQLEGKLRDLKEELDGAVNEKKKNKDEKKKNKAGNRERRAEAAVDGVLRGPGPQPRGQREAREGEGAEVWGGGAVA